MPAIIIMVHNLPFPIIFTFDAKMIIRLFHQLAGAGFRLMKPLRQDNGSRYTRPLHFRHRYNLIGIDIDDPICAHLRLQVQRPCYQQYPYDKPFIIHQDLNLFFPDQKQAVPESKQYFFHRFIPID